MSVYLFNDTSHGHAGSRATMRELHRILPELIAVNYCGDFHYCNDLFDKCDAVVVNGEGSIHHNNRKARFLMDVLARAQRLGKRTALVNSTYQAMPSEYDDILKNLDFFSVREWLSYEYCTTKGVHPELFIDLSVNSAIPRKNSGLKLFRGRAHPDVPASCRQLINNYPNAPTLDLSGDFQDVIDFLSVRAKTYVTGQYHGLIAGVLAGCQVLWYPSNSWKIEGLNKWAEVEDKSLHELILTAPTLDGVPV